MKNFKTVIVVMALFGAMITVNAQRTVVRVYPKHGTVVTTVKKPSVFVHKKPTSILPMVFGIKQGEENM